MKARARSKAQELKRRAYCKKKKLDPSFDVECGDHASPVGGLLREAAATLGSIMNCDVYTFEARLKDDWLFNADQLKSTYE